MRFALEVVGAVRAVWPKDRPLFFRTSAVEGAGGEWSIDDTLALAREAQRLRLRERHRKEYPPGTEVEIPFGPSEQVAYSWAARSAGPRDRR